MLRERAGKPVFKALINEIATQNVKVDPNPKVGKGALEANMSEISMVSRTAGLGRDTRTDSGASTVSMPEPEPPVELPNGGERV